MASDDILDDFQWQNVQEPVKIMFTALTKAIRTQAVDIRDLDRRLSNAVTTENASRLVIDGVNKCYSRDQGHDLEIITSRKADLHYVDSLETRLSQALTQVNKKIIHISS